MSNGDDAVSPCFIQSNKYPKFGNSAYFTLKLGSHFFGQIGRQIAIRCVPLCCYIAKELVESKGLNDGQMVKSLGQYIQGGGGGQAFFATAGGKNPDGLNTAIAEAKKLIASL